MSTYIENLKSRGWDNLIVDIGNEFKHIREELCISQPNAVTVASQSITFMDLNSNASSIKNELSEDYIKNELKKVREELNINSFSL